MYTYTCIRMCVQHHNLLHHFYSTYAYASNCALDRHTKLQILLKTVYHDEILILVCFILMTALTCADMRTCREH